MTKIEFVQSYIEKCDEYRNHNRLDIEITVVFKNDIKDIDWSLGSNVDKNIVFLKQILINYKADLLTKESREQRELEKLKLQAEIAKASNNINVTATGGNSTSHATSNATSTVTITIEQTIKAISEISNEVLSPDEKEKLQDDLYTLEGIKATKNKARFWDKAKAVLAFLTDKGADALIAAAPYIIAALKTM